MNITDIGALELETKAVNAQKYPDGVIQGKGRNSFAIDIGGTRLLDMNAFGTSEGVIKEWDSRGRDQQTPPSSTQHPEAGKFQQVVNNAKSGFTVHQSPNGSKVSVQTQTSPTGPNVAKVTHVSHTGNTSRHSGTHSQMHALVKSKFGIAHKGLQKGAQAHGKSFAHAGKKAVQKTSSMKKGMQKGKLAKSSKKDVKIKRSKENWFDRGVVVK
jgi:hypothetical protein